MLEVVSQTNSTFSQHGYLGVHFESTRTTARFSTAAIQQSRISPKEEQQLTPAECSALHKEEKNTNIYKHPAERKLPNLPALLSFGGRKHGFVLHMLQTIV